MLDRIMEIPIVDDSFLIEKRKAKSGFKFSNWTYILLPNINGAIRGPGGTVRVKGTIDNYVLNQYNLLPLKGNEMILPLKTEIRKAIGKGEGDCAEVVLYPDDSPYEIPEEILLCLLDAPKAYAFFETLSESNQKYYTDWIVQAKQLETRANRIVKMIQRLEKELTFYDWVQLE